MLYIIYIKKSSLLRELVLNVLIQSLGKDPTNEVLLITYICLGCNLKRGSGNVWTTRSIHHSQGY